LNGFDPIRPLAAKELRDRAADSLGIANKRRQFVEGLGTAGSAALAVEAGEQGMIDDGHNLPIKSTSTCWGRWQSRCTHHNLIDAFSA
jgi:hypothetical protein